MSYVTDFFAVFNPESLQRFWSRAGAYVAPGHRPAEVSP